MAHKEAEVKQLINFFPATLVESKHFFIPSYFSGGWMLGVWVLGFSLNPKWCNPFHSYFSGVWNFPSHFSSTR